QNTAAHFAHELGHIVGLRGYYRSYNRVPRCNITRYAGTFRRGTNASYRSEEFAEVFATYLHAPNDLKSACPDAFHWMRQNVFNSGPDPTESCTGRSNIQYTNQSWDLANGNNNGLQGQAAN